MLKSRKKTCMFCHIDIPKDYDHDFCPYCGQRTDGTFRDVTGKIIRGESDELVSSIARMFCVLEDRIVERLKKKGS